MSPQDLENAAAQLQDNGDSTSDLHGNEPRLSGDEKGLQSEDDLCDSFNDKRELTKTEALTELLRSKRKTPAYNGNSPTRGNSLTTRPSLSKRPRLTRCGSFFDDSDSETETKLQLDIHRKLEQNKAAHIQNGSGSASKQPIKGRHLNLSSSESESEEMASELLREKISEREHFESELLLSTHRDFARKRSYQSQESSEHSSAEIETTHQTHPTKMLQKAAKLLKSDSESENELVMDLEAPEIHSPPTNTLELLTGLTDNGDYGNQLGACSMETLAVSQSVSL